MILLDTNAVSEIVRPSPHPKVMAWFDRQADQTLFLSDISVAELLFGLRILPAGRRKDLLAVAVDRLLADSGERCLPFDTRAAETFADLAARARAAGRGFPVPDGYIAAIAAARGFAVATRDSSAFAAVGVEVIDPWAGPG